MRTLLRRTVVRLKRELRKVLQLQPIRDFIARLAAAAGAPMPLTTPAAALFGEGASPERRLLEVEAERDALVEELINLKQQIDEQQRSRPH